MASKPLDASFYGLDLGTCGFGLEGPGHVLGVKSCSDSSWHHSQTEDPTSIAKVTSLSNYNSTVTRDIDIAILSARDVPALDENGLTYRHSFFHPTVGQSF